MAADVLVRNAWYVAGFSHEFPPQQLQGQVIAEKPLVTRVDMRVWPAGRHGDRSAERGHIIVHTHTPVDRRMGVAADHQHAGRTEMQIRPDEIGGRTRFKQTFPAVIAEDRWALEKQQGMFEYPDDGYREVFLRPDRPLRRAREILMRLEEAEKILAS